MRVQKKTKHNNMSDQVMKSYYTSGLQVLKETITVVGSRKVLEIQPETRWPCLESYPCQGHGNALITLDEGSLLKIPCSSVSMGVLMWYFRCDNTHFTTYIDDEFTNYLLENI